MKVGLDGAAIAIGDLLVQRHAEALHDAALHLRADDVRLDGEADVNRGPDFVHADLAIAAIDGYISDERGMSVVVARVRDAERSPRAAARPVGHRRDLAQHLLSAGYALQHVEAVLSRILVAPRTRSSSIRLSSANFVCVQPMPRM